MDPLLHQKEIGHRAERKIEKDINKNTKSLKQLWLRQHVSHLQGEGLF